MKFFRRLLPQSNFFQKVGILAGGAAGAQFLTLLASPLLTRLYQPSDLGLLSVFSAVLSIFVVIGCLRYELAINLPESTTEARALVLLSICISICVSILLSVSILFFGVQVAEAISLKELQPYLWLLPIGVLLSSFFNVFNGFALRNKRYGDVAKARFFQTAGGTAIQLLGFASGAVTLLIAQVVGQAIGCRQLALQFFAAGGEARLTLRDLMSVGNRYRRFPIYSTGEGLFNTVGAQLPPLLLASLFSASSAGMYMLANRVLSMPLTLVANAVGQVFVSNAPAARREGQLSQLVENLFCKLIHLALPPAVLIMLCSVDVFVMVFGDAWRQAGIFCQFMVPWMAVVFVCSPISTVFTVLEKQAHAMIFQLILVASRVAAISYGAYEQDVLLTVGLFCASSFLCWTLLLGSVLSHAGVRYLHCAKETASSSFYALLCSVPLVIVDFFGSLNSVWWVLGFLASGIFIALRYLKMLGR